jgi:hypothetical protein
MLRLTALFCISIAMPGAAWAQDAKDAKDAKDDTVQVHGKALTLSCAETKCANGSTTAARSSPTDDPTKHRGRKHHSAEPSDGT